MAKYYEESPLYNVDWSGILGNVPRTNVGMVPIGNVWDYTDPGVPQLGYGKNWHKRPGYVEPRNRRAKDILGYSAYENVEGVPQLGIQDQLMPKIRAGTEVMYDRPEELEFGYDPNQPVPGGVYNTELNPYDPSSKFFPYETDYSGIMAAKALQESGDPIYDIARMDPSKLPPSERHLAEYTRPESEELFGVTTTLSPFDAPTKLNVGLNVPALEKEKGKIDSTLLHEARHYYQSKYGFDIGNLNDEQMHNLIYQFQGMFYNNPVDRRRIPYPLTKTEADAFMKMHQQGKKWYQSGQVLGESKAETKDRKRKEQLYGTVEQAELMEAGRKALGQTPAQVRAQERMMTYPHRGDVTTIPYTEGMQKAEAERSGGTVNPFEITKAVAREHVAKQQSEKREQRTQSRGAQRRTRPSRPRRGPHGAQGGLVSIDHLTRRL